MLVIGGLFSTIVVEFKEPIPSGFQAVRNAGWKSKRPVDFDHLYALRRNIVRGSTEAICPCLCSPEIR
jgi:hypothetical protein